MLHGSEYFSTKEFACKCGCGFGTKEEHIAADLIHALHCLRVKLDLPLLVNSGARCVKHNTVEKGGVKSTHLPGVVASCTPGYEGKCRAADINTSLWSLTLRAEAVQTALAMGLRVGIAGAFLHFDVERAPYYSNGLWVYGGSETSSGGS